MQVEHQLKQALQYLSAEDRKEVEHAMEKAKNWHDGQQRESGEPYIIHPFSVALFLTRLEASRDTLIAALLHDVVEDERVSLASVRDEFGETVARLVDGVTKLSKLRYEGRRAERQIGSLRKMLLTASDDLRVIFIKLADRWHNISTLDVVSAEKKVRIANETLDIYVPFARLMGLWELKSFFEEACFSIAYPEVSAEWHQAIEKRRAVLQDERIAFLKRVNKETSNEVKAEMDFMTDYEVYTKLQGNVSQLDIAGSLDSVNIIIHGEKVSPIDCYRLLGEIHARYPVFIGSFRDYINVPRPNGYRALHTTIFLSRNHKLTLRIQTLDMSEYAKRRKLSAWLQEKDNDIYKALNSLHMTDYDKEHFMSDLKATVLKERINVFTSSGEIITLPTGATGVDFAFSLNPNHVSHLSGIRINGEAYEVTHPLHDGDTVDLILLENGRSKIQPQWVEKAKSVEVRESLKRRIQRKPRAIRANEGMSILEVELRKRRLPVWWLHHSSSLQKKLALRLHKRSFDRLLEDIGTGLTPVSVVVDAFVSMIVERPGLFVSFLKLFHLLPRSRVLNNTSKIIDLEIYAEDRKGLIHDVTRCFVERDINIAQFGVFAVPPHDALYKIRLEVQNFDVFSDLFDHLMQVSSVKRVLRKT